MAKVDLARRRSQRLIAQVRRGGTDPEARANLQARLEVFSKLMFWSFVALLVFLAGMYRVYPSLVPRRNEVIFGSATILLAVMALIWRLGLVRRQPSIANLYRLDIGYAITIGLAFGGSAIGAAEFRPAGYASLIYATFVVFTRAIVVPSSGRRSLVVSILIFVPVVAAGIGLAITTDQDLPGPAFAIGGVLFAAIAVLLATIGSQVIYGLRQKVSEATQLGQYRLGRLIGSGGMGEVYHAQHTLLRRPTALKLLRPDRIGVDNLDRFEAEVQATSQLTHPNTIAIFDYGRNLDGILYYAMEYLDGLDLGRLVKTYYYEAPMPVDRVVRILAQVASALAEAHAKGFVHRDIKPGNVILCERGGLADFVKVVDFGLVVESARSGADLAGPAILGTPGYLAPEAVTGKVGPSADLYALGAVGYYLLTSRPVFPDAPPLETVSAHAIKPVVSPAVVRPAIPEALASLIVACLAKEPGDRPASALALVAALDALPHVGDWPGAMAKVWWVAFRAARTASEAVTHDSPTQTVRVDLATRA